MQSLYDAYLLCLDKAECTVVCSYSVASQAKKQQVPTSRCHTMDSELSLTYGAAENQDLKDQWCPEGFPSPGLAVLEAITVPHLADCHNDDHKQGPHARQLRQVRKLGEEGDDSCSHTTELSFFTFPCDTFSLPSPETFMKSMKSLVLVCAEKVCRKRPTLALNH